MYAVSTTLAAMNALRLTFTLINGVPVKKIFFGREDKCIETTTLYVSSKSKTVTYGLGINDQRNKENDKDLRVQDSYNLFENVAVYRLP